MMFEICGIEGSGTTVKASDSTSGVARETMTEAELAKATIFFWRALMATRIVNGAIPKVDQDLDTFLTKQANEGIGAAVDACRNIIVGQATKETP